MSKKAQSRPYESSKTKLLIPIGEAVDRSKIVEFLDATAAFRNPRVVLFYVVEAPSRTTPLDPLAYDEEIREAEIRLRAMAEWLGQQDLDTSSKVVVARNVAEAIVAEANSGGYRFIFLMKRKIRKRWRRFFQKSVTERVIRDAKCLVISSLVEF